MNIVATPPTQKLAAVMLAAAERDGSGDAVLNHLRDVAPDQLAALVALLVSRAVGKPEPVPESDQERMAREDATWTVEDARRAHKAYLNGDRTAFAIIGNRVYKRRADHHSPYYRSAGPSAAARLGVSA